MPFPRDTQLTDGTPIELTLAEAKDLPLLATLYHRIVAEGASYPHERPLTENEFLDYWVRGKSTVVAYPHPRMTQSELLGAYYLKANWPGRASHVANAGFIVAPEWRNRGLASLLATTMLDHAGQLGFRSVLFNLVFSENHVAHHLWEKLGFRTLGVIPDAVRKHDGSYQDALIMFRSLI